MAYTDNISMSYTPTYSGVIMANLQLFSSIGAASFATYPNFVSYETFEKHVHDRYGLVLIFTEKDSGVREIIPIQHTLDMIYKFACISPFDLSAGKLFEFNDEESSLEFELAISITESRDALTLTDAQLKEYHKHKAKDISYNIITV